MKTSILKIIASGIVFALLGTSFFFIVPRTQYAYAVGESDVPDSGLNSKDQKLTPGDSGTGAIENVDEKQDGSKCFANAGINMLLNKASNEMGKWINKGLGKIPGFGGVLAGGEVPTSDSQSQGLISAQSIATCIRDLASRATKVAVLRFKKRLLDRITNDTVAWINGTFPKGSPKFVTNFGDVLKEAGDKAIGDTLIQLGAGDLCYGLRLNLNLTLQQPPQFNEAFNCTLSRVIDNVEAFRDDFTQGGWLGYYETLKPQNNPVGLAYMTNEYMAESKSKLEKEAELKINNGYKSDEYCQEWILYAYSSTDGAKIKIMANSTPEFLEKNPDPNKPPEYKQAIANAIDPQWECNRKEIGIPANTISAIGTKALTSDTDYLINADDLTPYISAIFDSATNRLIKVGVKGLRSSISSLSSQKDFTQRNKSDPRNASIVESGEIYGGSETLDATDTDITNAINNLPSPPEPLINSENLPGNYQGLGGPGGDLSGGGTGYNTGGVIATPELINEVQTLILKVTNTENYNEISWQLLDCQKKIFYGGCQTTNNIINSTVSKNNELPGMNYKQLTDLKTALNAMLGNFTQELSSCRTMNTAYQCPAQ